MSRLNWDRAHTLPQDYRLRSAHPADLSQLGELLLTSFYPERPFRRWLYPLMRLGIQEDIKRRLKNSPHQYECLVVQTSGSVIVGTVEVSLRSQFWQPLQPRRPYIANVAVDYRHRRRGIAQQMLIACEAIVQTWGCRQLYLHVATDNPPALALYQKVGYRVSDRSLWRQRQMMVKELFF
ncbi:MAG: GNAT family N-acetyltransferase [Cyanobacteria bacterium J06627_3]